MKSKKKFLSLFVLILFVAAILAAKGTGGNNKEQPDAGINSIKVSDKEITQSFLYDVLQQSNDKFHWSAVVMDAKSGEVLDSYGDIERAYVPGTTFKAIPTAILLEKGGLELSDSFVGDPYEYGSVVIKSYNNQEGKKTFNEHFINLNQPLIIRAWDSNGSELNFQEEAATFFIPADSFSETDSIPYYLMGAEFEVSVMDMAKAYLCLAGSCDNTENVISEETAVKIRDLLHDTYLNYPYIEPELMQIQNIGEAAGLYGSNYNIEGESYSSSVSFAGFAPFDDPEIIFVVSFERSGESDELEEYKNVKNIIAAISTEVFEHYLPKRYFREITETEQLKNLAENSECFIYFGRPTCGPCKRVEPIIRNNANALGKDVFYFNTDRFRNSENLQVILEAYDIETVPSIIKVRDGKASEPILFVGEIELESYISDLLLQ